MASMGNRVRNLTGDTSLMHLQSLFSEPSILLSLGSGFVCSARRQKQPPLHHTEFEGGRVPQFQLEAVIPVSPVVRACGCQRIFAPGIHLQEFSQEYDSGDNEIVPTDRYGPHRMRSLLQPGFGIRQRHRCHPSHPA